MKRHLLKGTRCYLIGGMQYENGEGWRSQVKTSLKRCGIKFFDPYLKPFINDIPEDENARKELLAWMAQGRLVEVAHRMREIRTHDLRLVDLSDFLICHIRPECMSWGTQEEITTAVREKKPVFISVEGGICKTPLWLLGMVRLGFLHGSIESVIETVRDIDAGTFPIEDDFWKLLRPEYR